MLHLLYKVMVLPVNGDVMVSGLASRVRFEPERLSAKCQYLRNGVS